MRFKKLLMLDFEESTIEPSFWARIDALCDEKVLLSRDSPEVAKHLPSTDGILVNFLPVVDKKVIDSAPGLKYVGILATGYGRIDAAYAGTKNVVVCNIPGYSTESVAEFCFAVVLERLRSVEAAKVQGRAGDFSASLSGSELKGKKFGVVGLGSIGKRVAELAIAFGCETVYWSRNKKETGAKFTELADLFSSCDFISLNLELNNDTKTIISSNLINSLKPDAVFVNLAPMELVDVSALAERLAKNDVVFVFDHPDELSDADVALLSKHKNCVFYPPIGYTTKEATLNKQEIFVSNLENFLKGKPSNKVN